MVKNPSNRLLARAARNRHPVSTDTSEPRLQGRFASAVGRPILAASWPSGQLDPLETVGTSADAAS
jgi:hypothetical protein